MAKEWCLWLGERSELTGRLVCDGAGRSRTEQDGALAFAANARLRRVVSIIALIAFVLLPKPPLYHIPGNRQARESAAPCGRARRRAHPPCRPPRRRGSAAAGRAGRAARCRPCSGSTPPGHDRELLSAITMRVRLRARRAVCSTAPECPALPSPRRAVATRLQPSPNRAGPPCAALCFRYGCGSFRTTIKVNRDNELRVIFQRCCAPSRATYAHEGAKRPARLRPVVAPRAPVRASTATRWFAFHTLREVESSRCSSDRTVWRIGCVRQLRIASMSLPPKMVSGSAA